MKAKTQKPVKLNSKVSGLGSIESPELNPVLIHFISHLQRAAFRHKFKPFSYNIDGVELQITAIMCRALFWASKRDVVKYRALLQPARQTLLLKDARTKQFLNTKIHHFNLPVRLQHILTENRVYTMAAIANKGEYELKRMRGLGNGSITQLVNLFMANGCGSLFQ